ncbi:hypothetical protein BH09ACT8_BH09ACT8_04280 [soil metagenome]
MTMKPITDDAILEIVDMIFLQLGEKCPVPESTA